MILYRVIVEPSMRELEQEVEEAAKDNWTPQGGIAVILIEKTAISVKIQYYQAMIKQTDE